MQNWKKLVLMVAVLGFSALAYVGVQAQSQIEGYKLRVNSTAYGYLPVVENTATGNATTWALDSAATETSYVYQIIPGCEAAVFASCDAAADTVTNIFVDISADNANWAVLDTVGAVNGTAVTNTVLAKGADLKLKGRFIRFRAVNDDGAAAATVLTAHLVTTPSIND